MWTEEMEFAEGALSELIEAIMATPVTPVTPATPASTEAGGTNGLDDSSIFQTISPDWWGGERTFGGMVVAQALSAAARTVAPDLDVHSLHGYFLRPSRPGTRSTHKVERWRDGRSFSTREVVSEVEGRPTFRMACSFHRGEAGADYQLAMASDIPPPDAITGSDAPFPFEVRDLGATERRQDGTYLSTRRCWFRTRQRLSDDRAIHACVLAYLSDMTGAAFRPLSLNSWSGYTDASLDHALWFHRPRRADEWNLFDFQALVNASGRSTIRGTMYGEDGRLYLSMAQELLIREL
jgi:acyl-CoA thioesterase-2